MLFMNAVHEARRLDGEQAIRAEVRRKQMLVLKYMPLKVMPRSSYDPIIMMSAAGADLIRNYDMYFDRWELVIFQML